ncbi:cache domain-containing protein [Anaerobacillus sp. HL2]|nr:cache domain-containing protein [Anaerobacillus sp. HL2]
MVTKVFFSSIVNSNILAVAAPVKASGSDEIIGTLSVVVDQKILDELVHSGIDLLGETADSYMVNEEGLLLTNTMLGKFRTNAALNETINTDSVQTLAPHIPSADYSFEQEVEYLDYEGTPVIGAIGVVNIGDTPAWFRS